MPLSKDLYSRKDTNLVFSRMAMFYATTEQKLIHSYWNAWRISRKINQLHQVRAIHRLYTTLHETILGFADIGSMKGWSLKFKFESLSAQAGLWRSKGQTDVNYWWNMGDTSTKSQYFINDWYLIDLIFGVLMPLSTIFHLYHGNQF